MAKRVKIRRGQIIDVNLDPTKGSETGKTRPCVVVKILAEIDQALKIVFAL